MSYPPTPPNKTLFQTFEWHTRTERPGQGQTHCHSSHWSRLQRVLPSLSGLGVTAIWLPPGCKANEPSGAGNGYDCYDLWDLGEFDQKYQRATKWGSREELGDLIGKAKGNGVEIVWDAVLNHKTAGDTTEECWAVEVDGEDRRVETCQPRKIEPWIKYDFNGRGGTYSPMQWRACHFNGSDWDQRAEKKAIYKLIDDPADFPKPSGKENKSGNRFDRFMSKMQSKFADPPPVSNRPGKGWAEDVDDLHGNFDYLMFSNIDYSHPEARHDVIQWGRWMIENIGVDGLRLDAASHFSWTFARDWIAAVQETSRRCRGRDAFIVGEVWSGEVVRITKWLDVVGTSVHAYDTPLLYNFARISGDIVNNSPNADLRTILRNSLLSLRPSQAVTLVTNHDTQPGQSSATPIDAHLKTLFYAFILLRHEGYPCVFWGDLYGTLGPEPSPPACLARNSRFSYLPSLLLARKLFAYGAQDDYLDAESCIGWVRHGTHDRPGCAVVISTGPREDLGEKQTFKQMKCGMPGQTWRDLVGGNPPVQIERDGSGCFGCAGGRVGVWVCEGTPGAEYFPVTGFDLDVYSQ